MYFTPIIINGVECYPQLYCETLMKPYFKYYYNEIKYKIIENILNIKVSESMLYSFQRFIDEYNDRLINLDLELNYTDDMFHFHQEFDKIELPYVYLYVTGVEKRFVDSLSLNPCGDEPSFEEDVLITELIADDLYLGSENTMPLKLCICVHYYAELLSRSISYATAPKKR